MLRRHLISSHLRAAALGASRAALPSSAAAPAMLHAAAPFTFSWHLPDTAAAHAKRHKFQSPMWVALEDVKWVAKKVTPLKAAAPPADGGQLQSEPPTLTCATVPTRLVVYNMRRCCTTARCFSAWPSTTAARRR